MLMFRATLPGLDDSWLEQSFKSFSVLLLIVTDNLASSGLEFIRVYRDRKNKFERTWFTLLELLDA